MILRILKPVAAMLVLALVAYQPTLYAASIPSKTAPGQTDAARAADLAMTRAVLATDAVESALAAEGLTPAQIGARMEALSTQDLIALLNNPAQIRSAGISMTRRTWTVLAIGGAALIGAFALYDDGEDSDNSDDGED